ncbi:MAG: T9SS type A sorting domain-containing protein [Bacteroidetes bacterium]|nr:T9SS type A sorting domain-containing protein [Bacteroidota bacterium]
MRASALFTKFLLVSFTVLSSGLFAQSNNPIFGGGNQDGFHSECFRQSTSNFIFFGASGDGFHAGCYTIPSANLIFSGAAGDGYVAGCYQQRATNAIFGGSIGDGNHAECFVLPTNNLVFGGGNGDGFHAECFKQSTSNLIFGGSFNDGFSAGCFTLPGNNNIFAGSNGDGFDTDCATQATSNSIFAGSNGDGFDAICSLGPACGPGNDGTPPDMICQDVTVQLNDGGQAVITIGQIDGGSSDVCGIASLNLSQSLFDCSDLGSNSIELIGLDNSGNTDSCNANVLVEDNILPVAKCMDVTIQIGTGGSAILLAGDIDNGSYDNCSINSMTVDSSTFTCADTGSYLVTLTVFDVGGNNEQCQSNVTVLDDGSNCIPPCDTQQIDLALGWNIMSSYIIADNPDMLDVIQEVASDIIIIKDNAGTVAFPSLPLNLIGDWDVTQGYKVKTANTVSFTMGCTQVAPESTPITLNAGWNMISFLRTDGLDAIAAFAPVQSNVVIVKDALGNIYIPSLTLNLIGDLLPGQGYQVKMTALDMLTYPANSARFSESTYREIQGAQHFVLNKNTGNNATIIIPDGVLENISIGDEIGVFSNSGELTGSVVYFGGHTAFAVWGRDGNVADDLNMEEGEYYQFRVWRNNIGEEELLEVTYSSGEAHYTKDGISVIGVGVVSGTEETVSDSYIHIYPNPANTYLNFEIHLPERSGTVLEIFDLSGRSVIRSVSEQQDKGETVIRIDVSGLATGEYIYRLSTESTVLNGGFVKIR